MMAQQIVTYETWTNNIQRDFKTDNHRDIFIVLNSKETDRQRDRETERQTERKTERQRDRRIQRQLDTEIDR